MVPQQLGSYEIREQLAEGGFGTVYRAYQSIIDREVAIKVISSRHANDPTFLKSFEAEAHIIAHLEHPFIVPLYDYWRDPDGIYLVMRWLRGGTLTSHLKNRALSEMTVIKYFDQLTSALHAAHRYGVIHRDVKPDNILLDEDNNVYLSDFGIAVEVDKSQLETDELHGSLPYLAPELISGTPASLQSDIYSLGIVLFEMLTGQYPYRFETVTELIFQHQQEPLPDIAVYAGPQAEQYTKFNTLLQKSTAKDPQDRYADIIEFANAFREIINGAGASVVVPVDDSLIFNPYKGLRPFEEADAIDFFGRESLVQELLNSLKNANTTYTNFLAVVGPSGSGKSSVVNAGLIPAIRGGALAEPLASPSADTQDEGEAWTVVRITPGTTPFENLINAFNNAAPDASNIAANPAASLAASAATSTANGFDLTTAIQAITKKNGAKKSLLLFIDQFEELFTMVDDKEIAVRFMKQLKDAIQNTDARILIALRADYYDKPLGYQEFGEIMQQRTKVVLPLNTTEIEQSISRPAQQVGLEIDTDLIATIVADVKDEPGMLPLLQFTLTDLFENKVGRQLNLQHYHDNGGVTGTLARRAQELYDNLTPEQQEITRQVFLRLVSLGEGLEDTRRRALMRELVDVIKNKAELQTVIERFNQARLLTMDFERVSHEPTVEVAHEALIRTWQQLKEWINTARNDIRLQRMLSAAAREWVDSGRKIGFLLYGARLALFEDWIDYSLIKISQEERAYVAASIQHRENMRKEEEERQRNETLLKRRAQNRQRIAMTLGLFLIIVFGLFGLALYQRAEAQQNAAKNHSLSLAFAAQQAMNDNNPDLAIALALESMKIVDPPLVESERMLSEVAYGLIPAHRFFGHDSRVYDLDVNSDGTTMVSASDDGTLMLWDLASNEVIQTLEGHDARVFSAAFDPTGSRVASGAINNTLILWNLADGSQLWANTLEGGVFSTAFSPDGQTLLTGDLSGFLQLWNAETGELVRRFPDQDGRIFSVAYHPDNTRIASGGEDGLIHLFDLQSGEETATISGHEADVTSVTFSDDGLHLLSGSDDGSIRLWELETGAELRRLQGHTDEVKTVDISADGRYALSGSEDWTVRLWDLETGSELGRYVGHNDDISAVEFFGHRSALSSSFDGTLAYWDLRPSAEIIRFEGFEDGTTFASFHPDGVRAIAASDDHTVRLWDTTTGEELRVYEGHEEDINSTLFNPDGTLFVSASDDGLLRVWDVESGELLHTLTGHEDIVWNAEFSRDGSKIVSASDDGTARVWDAATGETLLTFTEHGESLSAVAFDVTGERVVSGDDSGVLMLWSAESGEIIRTFAGHGDAVSDVEISADNTYLVSSSDDRSIRLWELETGRMIRVFQGHNNDINSVAFSPDGSLLVSSADDRTIRLWNTASGDEIRRLNGHSGDVINADFNPDGTRIISTSDDRTVRVWVMHSRSELVDWTLRNRYVRNLTCFEQALYEIEVVCELE